MTELKQICQKCQRNKISNYVFIHSINQWDRGAPVVHMCSMAPPKTWRMDLNEWTDSTMTDMIINQLRKAHHANPMRDATTGSNVISRRVEYKTIKTFNSKQWMFIIYASNLMAPSDRAERPAWCVVIGLMGACSSILCCWRENATRFIKSKWEIFDQKKAKREKNDEEHHRCGDPTHGHKPKWLTFRWHHSIVFFGPLHAEWPDELWMAQFDTGPGDCDCWTIAALLN